MFERIVLAIAVAATAGAIGAQDEQKAPDPRVEMSPQARARHEQLMAEKRADFEHQGVQVGGQLADLEVRTLDGKSIRFSELRAGKPTLLVSASLTCPVARERQEWVDRIALRFGERLNVAVVYTQEAHPMIDPSPYAYSTPELENPEHPGERLGGNAKLGLARRQPTDLEQRGRLAQEYVELLDVRVPIVLDRMGNEAWSELGSGPNVGVLLRPDGTVAVKHGWFDGETMERSIEYLLAESEQERAQ
jgi:hypothetical protein